jgi:hypothetical protein
VAKRSRELSLSATTAVERLRVAARSLVGVVETVTFGNPTFKVGERAIAVIDRYDGRDCLWLRIPQNDREILLKQPGWFASPYDPKRTALCCSLQHFKWRGLKGRLRQSYNLAQTKTRKPSDAPPGSGQPPGKAPLR